MSIFINAISALGNNSGVCPLLVRDCAIEVPTKVFQTYKQNEKESPILAKHALRERSIDEYSTTAVWVGGVPTVEFLFNKILKLKGINGNVNYNLLKNNESPNNKNQSLDINIKNFKNIAPKEVNELEKIKKNKLLFKNFTVMKYASALAIPIALMGFVIPKANFALSKFLMNKDANKGLLPEKYLKNNKNNSFKSAFPENIIKTEYKNSNNIQYKSLNSLKNNNSPSFKGFSSFMTDLSHQQKMAVTDGGYAVGRIVTSRKRNEKIENIFKMSSMMYLNFVAPKKIEKGLNYLTNKVFGINPELDPKIMSNKRFLALSRSGKLELPNSEDEVLIFLDSKPKSLFSKIVKDSKGVKYLESGIRDPREYVDVKKIYDLSQKIKKFCNNARVSGNVSKYAQKALMAKSVNIMMNILISSILLSVALPQAQFALRKKLFNSNVEPGLS